MSQPVSAARPRCRDRPAVLDDRALSRPPSRPGAALRGRDVGAILVLRDAGVPGAVSRARAPVERQAGGEPVRDLHQRRLPDAAVGGYLADRFIGTRRSVVLGSIVIALGHFCLAIPAMPTFYVGLGLIIAGTGFFKPNAATMVGQMYRQGDPRRDSGFTIYYMGVNAGAFLGPIICGLLAESIGWHWGFAAAGVGMVAGLYLPRVARQVPARHRRKAEGVEAAAKRRPCGCGPPDAVHGPLARWRRGGGVAHRRPGAYPMLLGVAVGAVVAITVLGTQGADGASASSRSSWRPSSSCSSGPPTSRPAAR